MKPAPLTFCRPKSADEAIALVAGHRGFAKYLAGGQTLGPMINLRLVQADLLVDVSRLDDLRMVSEERDAVVVGSGIPHAAFEDGLVPDVTNGLMRRVAAGIAYRAIRNRGTLGGSLAHADPAAEWPTVMSALDACVLVRGTNGRREIPIERFLCGAMTTALADDEMIVAIRIPRLSRTARWGFQKRCRKVGDFAYSLAAVVIDRERRVYRAVLGATDGAPLRLAATSRALAEAGSWVDGRDTAIRSAYESDIDAHGLTFDEYDRHVHGVAVIRAAKEALST